eukprot:jgi/Mesvir1/14832/Mv05458-RA.1
MPESPAQRKDMHGDPGASQKPDKLDTWVVLGSCSKAETLDEASDFKAQELRNSQQKRQVQDNRGQLERKDQHCKPQGTDETPGSEPCDPPLTAQEVRTMVEQPLAELDEEPEKHVGRAGNAVSTRETCPPVGQGWSAALRGAPREYHMSVLVALVAITAFLLFAQPQRGVGVPKKHDVLMGNGEELASRQASQAGQLASWQGRVADLEGQVAEMRATLKEVSIMRDWYGSTALSWAQARGCVELERLLLDDHHGRGDEECGSNWEIGVPEANN